YMSPEQSRGDVLDGRSDLFSAGVVIHELLTGETLFSGRTIDDILDRIQVRAIPAPSVQREEVPSSLDRVIGRLLERDPAARYQSAADALRDLTRVSYELSVIPTRKDVTELIKSVSAKPDATPGSAGSRSSANRSSAAAASADSVLEAELFRMGVTAGEGTEQSARITHVGTAAGQSAGVDGRAKTLMGHPGSPAEDVTPDGVPNETTGFVRRGRDSKGFTIWEPEEHTQMSAEELSPPVPTRPRWRRPIPWLIAGFLSVAMALTLSLLSSTEDTGERSDGETGSIAGETAAIAGDGSDKASAGNTAGEAAETPTRTATPAVAERPDERADDSTATPSEAAADEDAVALTQLTVNSKPDGASVRLDGKQIGETPLSVEVPADGARHAITLSKKGYDRVKTYVTLRADEPVKVARSLERKVRYGTIDLNVDPWAFVYLNGKRIAETPAIGLRLPVGTHRLKLVNTQLNRTKVVTVTVPGKRPYRFSLR
ncbi:MAG: PEGA domain-containing protein, partial [Myxococcota bacterium]